MQKIEFRSWCLGVCQGVLINVLAGIILAHWSAPAPQARSFCTAPSLIEVASQVDCI